MFCGAVPCDTDNNGGNINAECEGTLSGPRDVTLYFRQAASTTIKFVEEGNPDHVLRNPIVSFADEVNVYSIYNSLLNADAKLESGGKEYTLFSYDDGNNPLVPLVPIPLLVRGINNRVVTLYFSTTYNVVQMFHGIEPANNTDEVWNVIPLGEYSENVAGGGDFISTGYPADGSEDPEPSEPPLEINIGSVKWEYIGYRIGWNDEEPLHAGVPANLAQDYEINNNVREDLAIIYVYAKDEAIKVAQVSHSKDAQTARVFSTSSTGTKSAPTQVYTNDLIKYTLFPRATQLASDPPYNMTVIDAIPAGTEFVESEPPNASVNGRTITLTNPEFDPAHDEFTITVRAKSTGTFTNTAIVTVNGVAKSTNKTFIKATADPCDPCFAAPNLVRKKYTLLLNATGGLYDAFGELLSEQVNSVLAALSCKDISIDTVSNLNLLMQESAIAFGNLNTKNSDMIAKIFEIYEILDACPCDE
jgi:hypothetical protein